MPPRRIVGPESIEIGPYYAYALKGDRCSEMVLHMLKERSKQMKRRISCTLFKCREDVPSFRTYPLGSVVPIVYAPLSGKEKLGAKRIRRFFSYDYLVKDDGTPICPPILFGVKVYPSVDGETRAHTVAKQIYADLFDSERFLAHVGRGYLPWDESYKNHIQRFESTRPSIAVQLAAMAAPALATAD